MSGLSPLKPIEWEIIGQLLECFLYGIYSAIFLIYFQYRVSKKCADKRPNIIFYSLCTLYVLSVALVIIDTWVQIIFMMPVVNGRYLEILGMVATVINGCCDFIAQSILIYRCWIVWNHNIRVMILPSILAFGFLVLWLAGAGSEIYKSSRGLVTPEWGYLSTLTSVGMTLAVNTLVTGLIVFKIFKVYCEVKPLCGQTSGGSKLRATIFMIIESCLALFCIQLAYLVAVLLQTNAVNITLSIQRMLNGITPTIIQVRVIMGLSFHDQESMVDVTGSLRFASANDLQDSTSRTEGVINIDHQGQR